MNIVGLFLATLLGLAILALTYLTFSQKSHFEVDRLDLITSEQILDRSFNLSKSISDVIKRDKLSLVNENNTIIITWQMYLPNIGGEFYWTSNYNKDKPIIRIGTSPHIFYNAKQNKLKVLTKYQYSPFDNHYPLIELEDINFHLEFIFLKMKFKINSLFYQKSLSFILLLSLLWILSLHLLVLFKSCLNQFERAFKTFASSNKTSSMDKNSIIDAGKLV